MPSEAVLQRAERKRLGVKQELADAAFDVFAERGYHATRVADITAHLGVGQSTFYKHFDNKRDVIDHVLGERLAAVMQVLAEENAAGAADTLEDYVTQVHRITVALFETLARDPRALKVMLFEVSTVDHELEQRWQDVLDIGKTIVIEYYANGIAKGYFRQDIDVDASSDAVLGILLGGLLRILRQPDDQAGYLRFVDAALDMIVKAATHS